MTNRRKNVPSKMGGSAYSRNALRWLRNEAMKVDGVISVKHLFPRVYCIAKPAPLCAVFVKPWMDSEPQVRNPEYSAFDVVYEGVHDVRVGDWCSLAYVVKKGCSQMMAFPIPFCDEQNVQE